MAESPTPWRIGDMDGDQIFDANGDVVAYVYPNEGGGIEKYEDVLLIVKAVNAFAKEEVKSG